jgi:hypothetical protein
VLSKKPEKQEGKEAGGSFFFVQAPLSIKKWGQTGWRKQGGLFYC